MAAFWLTAADLPAGSGFALFGPAHLCWLGIALAFFAVLCLGGRRSGPLLSRCMAWALVLLELGKDLYLLAKGQLAAANLPFYLCGFTMFLILLDALRPCAFLLDVLYGLCLPGAAAALVFPNWGIQPPFNLISSQAFVFHILLVGYILFQLALGRRPNARHGFFSCVLFLAGFVPFVKLLDAAWGTNYLFLEHPSPGSPLMLVAQWFGPLYLLGFALFGALLMEGMYLPLQLAARRRGSRSR